jgi:hypothetical protein
MFKHPENTMAVNPKTLDFFSVFRVFSRDNRFPRESILLNAPETSGVYGLYNACWIYLGEADNIKRGLLEHLTGEDACINRHQPFGFAFELVHDFHHSKFRHRLYQLLI